jgi:transmembrane sensor
MTRPHRRLADQLDFEPDDAALEREWAAIATRQRSGRLGVSRRSTALVSAVLALCVVAVLAYSLLFAHETIRDLSPGAIGLAGTLFSNEASTGVQHVRLPDGSSIELAASARVRVLVSDPSEVTVELERSRAVFDVRTQKGRRFSVAAGFVEVTVKGTRFSVERTSHGAIEGVTISVERGSVEVARLDGFEERTIIPAGTQWRASRGFPSSAVPVDDVRGGSIAPQPPPPEPIVRSGKDRDVDFGSTRAAVAPPSAMGALPTSAESAEAAPPALTATGLFGAAEAAMRADRPSEAESMFAAFLQQFPDDDRAGLAALELGRLRLDVLGDARGSLEALNAALTFGNKTPFAEDAAARRIEALERLGDINSCADAREAFLVAYPASVHAASVSRRCRER